MIKKFWAMLTRSNRQHEKWREAQAQQAREVARQAESLVEERERLREIEMRAKSESKSFEENSERAA